MANFNEIGRTVSSINLYERTQQNKNFVTSLTQSIINLNKNYNLTIKTNFVTVTKIGEKLQNVKDDAGLEH